MKKIFSSIVLTFLILSPVLAEDGRPTGHEMLLKSGLSYDGIELPEYNKGKPEIAILKSVVPPGMEVPSHTHTVIAAGVLLSGELTVISDDNEKIHLKAGDAIIEAVGKYYSAINEGTEPAVILVFFASVKGEPLIVNRQ